MIELAAIALVVSSLLSAAAIASFSWSVSLAKWLLPSALVVAALAVLAFGFVPGSNGLRTWTFLFACGACGCCATAARNLFDRPTRWVHRFVIYAGYGATFAAMGAVGLWLEARAVSGWQAIGGFIGVYAFGSVCVFVGKTITVRSAAKTMPQYHASLADGQNRPDYW